MGTAYVFIDYEKIDSLYDSEYIMDIEGKVITEIENFGATEIEQEKFPNRIKFSYSDERVVENIMRYVTSLPFLTFKKEFIRKRKGAY